MPNWIAISTSQLGGKHYLPRRGYTFAAESPVVSVLLAELAKVLPHYVLGFIAGNSGYYPVVLTGIGNQNLYLSPEGRWLVPYVPAALRGFPFSLRLVEDNLVLCLREDYLGDSGQPLFDAGGNLTKPVQETLNFLNECEKNRRVTQSACAALDKAGVIEKWSLQIKREEGQESVRLDGLFRISEQAFCTLWPRFPERLTGIWRGRLSGVVGLLSGKIRMR